MIKNNVTFQQLKPYLQLIRPHYLIKNLLVFAPFLLSHESATHSKNIIVLLYTFGVFCIASASLYTFNDLVDSKNDINDPYKRKRPIASSNISKSSARIFFIILTAAFHLLGISLLSESTFVAIELYFFLGLTYTLYLKKVLFFDALTLSIMYTSRFLAGTYTLSLEQNISTLIPILFYFIGLTLLKRTNDLKLTSKEQPFLLGRAYSRRHLRNLRKTMYFFFSLAFIIALITINSEPKNFVYHVATLAWTINIVLKVEKTPVRGDFILGIKKIQQTYLLFLVGFIVLSQKIL